MNRLARVVSFWDVTWQAVNIMVGASIFVTPGVFVQALGMWATLPVLVAYAGILPVVLVFAEAAGRYRTAGGMYRYIGDAFGDYAGAQAGFLYWIVRIAASAAVLNVLATYAAELWPRMGHPLPRALVMTVVAAGAAYVNIRGARQAAVTLNMFAAGKLIPLVILCGAAFFVASSPLDRHPPRDLSVWARATLLWVFAFGGFEAAMIPASEVVDPERNGPRALLVATGLVAIVYVLVQLVVVLVAPGETLDRPVAGVARIIAGPVGATLVSVGVLVSAGGHILGSMFAGSRITFAMAERGGLPGVIAQVHPVFNTPITSICIFAAGVWALAVSGTFAWNAYLSAVARLVVYAATALAVLRLRRNGQSSFVAPIVAHYATTGFCLWLLTNQTRYEALAVTLIIAVGSLVWWIAGGNRAGTR